MAVINFVRRRRPFLILNPHLVMPHCWLPYLPTAICVGFGMCRTKHHNQWSPLFHSQAPAGQAQTMRLYQEPHLSPQGIHCERKLVEAWKPTGIIIRLLGQQLTTNISRWIHVAISRSQVPAEPWAEAALASHLCSPCLGMNVRCEEWRALQGACPVTAGCFGFHKGTSAFRSSSDL